MLNLILTIVQVLCGLAVIAVVMLQSGKSSMLSGIIFGQLNQMFKRSWRKLWNSLSVVQNMALLLWVLVWLVWAANTLFFVQLCLQQIDPFHNCVNPGYSHLTGAGLDSLQFAF